MVASNVEKEFDTQLNDFVKANVMIVGGTGVGKSSLVNCVFGKEVAKVGSGKPQTKGINVFDNKGSPVVIFDTEGYEIFDGEIDNSNFKTVVLAEVNRRSKLDLKDQIHLFWYCLSVGNHRITEYDIENIKSLKRLGVDLAIVLTKCDIEEIDDNDEGVTSKVFKEILSKEGIDLNNIFETIAEGDENLEIDKLIEWSVDRLTDDDLRAAFVGAQKKSLTLKNREANKIINLATIAAAGAGGLNPLPLADSLILVPIQTGLAIKLASIYGFTSLGEKVMDLLKAQVVSLIGKQIATSLTKFIPIIGQFINASVAGSLTLAIGHGLKTIYTIAYTQHLETGKEPDWAYLFNGIDLDALFSEAIKKKKEE